ncbi:MAG: HEAT repeat domain-containing protein [Planctomycetia bacterium]|nr:HEAT repeat domain-containing protein [Planctomycetia bacterium]
MKKTISFLSLLTLGLFLCVTTVNAQNNDPKLADYLDAMVNGPAQANDNGSTFESARAHRPGPHEDAYKAWQLICHQMSAPGADSASIKAQMKDVLATDGVPADVKVWMIKQFQWIGNEADIPTLAPFLTSQEYTLRDEAIRTISTIPGQKAVDVLKNAAEKADDADKQRIQSALAQRTQDISCAVETEFPQALPYVSDAEVEKYLKDYASFSVEKKILTLASLTVRGDRKYAQYAIEAISAEGEDADALRREGILALEKLGSTKDIPLLLGDCLQFDRGLAIRVAGLIEADGFDAELLKYTGSEDNNVFSAVMEILANRRVDVMAPIMARMSQEKCADRGRLMDFASVIATKEDIPALVDTLGLFAPGRERDDAERRIVAVCGGDSAPVLTKERDLNVILPLLGRIGDERAWQIIDENLKKAEYRDMALRGLSNLPNAKQAEKMLAIVDATAGYTDEQKIAALRAYIRVVSLPNDKIGIRAGDREKLAMLKEAFSRATRIDEKKLVLSRLNAIRTVDSAKFAQSFFNDPELVQDAYRAFIDLAHHDNLRRPNADFFRPGLDIVIEKCTDQGLVTRAKKYRGMM